MTKRPISILYENGSTQLSNEMLAMQSTMRSAGIELSLTAQPFSAIIGTAFGNCSYATPCSCWQIVAWASTDSLGFSSLPPGDALFVGGNPGDYTSSANSANILATTTASNAKAEMADLYRYENYLAKSLPFVYMPNGPFQDTVYQSDLKGLLPQGIFYELTPQDYVLSK